MSDESAVEPPLSIGELFPRGEVRGEWLFSLSVVVDNLRVLQRQLGGKKTDAEIEDFSHVLMLQSLLSVRLYEARRLVYAVGTHADLRALIEPLDPWWTTLRDAYTPQDRSRVDKLYALTRHQGVHYMRPGSDELGNALDSVRNYPASMRIIEDGENRTIETEWVQLVAGLSVFGELGPEGWKSRLDERTALTTELVGAWLMLFALALVLYAHDRGIDLSRFLERVAPGGPGGVDGG